MNPKLSLLLSLSVGAWLIYDLMAPGEAMRQPVLIMHYVFLLGCCMGVVGALMRMSTSK